MRQTVVGQGGDCSPLVGSDLGDFDSLNQTGLISMALLSQPAVQLLDYNIVCIAQGTMKDTWRMVSGVASYMLAGGMDTVQFHFQCESDGSAWNTTIINSTDFVLTSPPNATFDTMNRTDCALCVSPEQLPGGGADNDQHCVCKFQLAIQVVDIYKAWISPCLIGARIMLIRNMFIKCKLSHPWKD